MGGGARTPSGYYWVTLEQSTGPPNTHIEPCLHPKAAGIQGHGEGAVTLRERDNAIKKKKKIDFGVIGPIFAVIRCRTHTHRQKYHQQPQWQCKRVLSISAVPSQNKQLMSSVWKLCLLCDPCCVCNSLAPTWLLWPNIPSGAQAQYNHWA